MCLTCLTCSVPDTSDTRQFADVIKSIRSWCVILKDAWLLVPANEKRWHLLTPIRITGKAQGQTELVFFLSTHLLH